LIRSDFCTCLFLYHVNTSTSRANFDAKIAAVESIIILMAIPEQLPRPAHRKNYLRRWPKREKLIENPNIHDWTRVKHSKNRTEEWNIMREQFQGFLKLNDSLIARKTFNVVFFLVKSPALRFFADLSPWPSFCPRVALGAVNWWPESDGFFEYAKQIKLVLIGKNPTTRPMFSFTFDRPYTRNKSDRQWK